MGAACPTCKQKDLAPGTERCPPVLLANENGVPISGSHCWSCGKFFTVCPFVPLEQHKEGGAWSGCQAPNCETYDPERDVDKMFGDPNFKIIREDPPKERGYP